jgi:hypothetical protein
MMFTVPFVVMLTALATPKAFVVCGFTASVTVGRAFLLHFSSTPTVVFTTQLSTTVTDTNTCDERLSAKAGRKRAVQIAIAGTISEKKNGLFLWNMTDSFTLSRKV